MEYGDPALEQMARDRAEELEARRAYSLLVEDRQRLAADLHDLVIQRLYACQLALTTDATDAVDRVIDELDEAIRELRTCIYELRTSKDTTPLIERIKLLIEAARPDHQTNLRVTGTPALIPDYVAQHVLAVVRESVSNVIRHADATTLDVSVDVTQRTVTLQVVDDGRGIDTSRAWSGLQNLCKRAEQLGGTCTVRGGEGGTVLTWRVPISGGPGPG